MTTATIYHEPECDYFELHPPIGSPIQLPTLAGAVQMAYILAAPAEPDVELVTTDDVTEAVFAFVVAEQRVRYAAYQTQQAATAAMAFRPGAGRREMSRDKHGQYRGRGEW
jgi:hypothetical protein